jgi:two-component system chemotaxis response regulator CheB
VDVVTLDMEMPDMDGVAVLKLIRSRNHQVRVIVFSSQTTRGAEKGLQALQAGADDIIAKPPPLASQGDSYGTSTSHERIGALPHVP